MLVDALYESSYPPGMEIMNHTWREERIRTKHDLFIDLYISTA